MTHKVSSAFMVTMRAIWAKRGDRQSISAPASAARGPMVRLPQA